MSEAEFLTYKHLGHNGRLGNQLWQIAATIDRARVAGLRPRFPRWEYEKYFNVPSEYFVDELPAGRDMGTGYFQELECFANVVSDIRRWFQPSKLALQQLLVCAPSLIASTGDCFGHFTGIHVRRGDYLNLPNHFPLVPMTYYDEAMSLVEADHPETVFLVFSDDPDWCRSHFPNDCVIVDGVPRPIEVADRVGEPQDQYDFFLLTHLCDRHIISNSTFAWWAAYLSSDPAPFYPGTWFGSALADIRWRRMFDSRWEEIAC